MYFEYPRNQAISTQSVLALDWEETTSDYPLAFKVLAERFERVIIVTVNDDLTTAEACECLHRSPDTLKIFCCPDEWIVDVPGWKSTVCLEQQVALMFDDSPDVVRACHKKGINAICVSERTWKFDP
ncbi:hypothetical protein [Marinicella meishanensis]|uniref:hypothetical protein n=1 Tax=Marinicella meishanensis TaxID=2873263 RepID=UPI001CBD2310|nr:hypothetical protein [Marinicella sp. NBU2979]